MDRVGKIACWCIALLLAWFADEARAQNFSLSSGGRLQLLVPQGGTGTCSINVVPSGGFAGTVAWSAGTLPAGVTAAFDPAAGSATTLTLTVGAAAATGSADLTVTGTSGSLVRTLALQLMVTAADGASPFTWPSYSPDLNFDYQAVTPDLANPEGILNDVASPAGTIASDGSWHFRYGPNKNGLVTSAAWRPMLNRLNYDFAWFRENFGWPADLRHRSGYFSGVYLFGSQLGTDNAANTDGGGWQGATNYQGRNWPMILMSYYPVYSFDPNCTYADRVGQQGATVHEGIHAMFADAPGVKQAAWFHEGGNTFLQGEQAAQLTGNYSSMGWLSATSALAPFMPIECYSGWLQDGSFGGPAAEGVNQNSGGNTYGSTWRQLFGGVQYSEAFPHFLHEIVSPGSVGWIWQNCPTRVLEGMANQPGGMGAAQMRRLIMEYRARMALCDMGRWSGAYQALLNGSWGGTLGPEYTPYWIAADPWTVTCYQPTTNNDGVLTPQAKTLPGWTGANYVPLTVTGTFGSTVSVGFNPLGNSQIIVTNPSDTSSNPTPTTANSQNMTCQLVYRAADGSAVYGQPVTGGTCSIRLDKAARGNVVIAVITSTDFVYAGEDSRKRKFDYRLTLGSGVTGTANVNTKWYQTTVQPALKALPGSGENHVFWSAVSGATSYTLRRATVPGGPYSALTTTSSLQFTDTGLTNGTTYHYIATAASGTQTSVNSNEVAATPAATAIPTPNSGFQTPAVSGQSQNPAGASWTFRGVSGIAAAGSTYISGNRPAPQGSQVAFLQNKGAISQTISGFTPGTSYTVRFLASQRQSVYQLGNIFDLQLNGTSVKSFFPLQLGSTWGEYSATFTATAASHTLSFNGTNANGGTSTVLLDRVLIVPAAAAAVPPVPTNVAAATTGAGVRLEWRLPPQAASSSVKRSTTSGGGYATLAANLAGTTFTDTTAETGTTYYYVISGSNPAGESANSVQVLARRSDELQLHLKFDETSGTTAADASGNGRTGTLTNATWTAGNPGNAVSLSGSNSYVRLPNGAFETLNDYTISTWVRLNSLSTWSRIFDFGSGSNSYLFLTPQWSASRPGILRFGARMPGYYEQVLDSSIAITTNTWTHIALSQTGPVLKLYLNGRLAGICPSMPVVPSKLGATTANYLGRSQFSDPYLNGRIDDFRVYNRGLSGGEVAALAGTYTARTPAVAYWNFEEGAADSYVPYAPTNPGYYDGSVRDLCGGDNNLSAWGPSWAWYRPAVPAASTPGTGLANTRSLQNANTTPGLTATDTPLTSWTPARWTLEAAIRPDGTTGTQTFIGRDSQNAYQPTPSLSALSFSVRASGRLALQFTDLAANNWNLESATGVIAAGKWSAVAATSDGATLSLFVRSITDNAPAYTRVASLDISSSANPAITTGDGDGANWNAGDFTLGRGLSAGTHAERFLGSIDDVRFSAQPLAPDQFLYSIPPAAPTSLAAIAAAPGSVGLTWAATPGAATYQVKRSATAGGPYTIVASDLATPSHTDAGLATGSTWYYVVAAENAAGGGPDSAEAAASLLGSGQSWRLANFGTSEATGDAAWLADPDGDGLANLWEFFHGGNPKGATPSPWQAETSGGRLSITFVRDPAATDLSVVVQAADSPAGPWTDLAGSLNGAPFAAIAAGASVEETGDGTRRTVTVRDSEDAASHSKRFLRLQARTEP